MRSILASLVILIAAASHAFADTRGDAAWRNCNLSNLGACQNSNQLFWGLTDKSGKSAAKHEFRVALAEFLRGAPQLYLGKTGFGVAQIASNALVGPGDHHDRLPGGGWFFDGFTPHDAQERGAVLFDSGGAIKLVALLNVEADKAGPDPGAEDMNHYRLRVYSHNRADAADVRLLQNWAGYKIETDNRSGRQTRESLIRSELVTFENNQWRLIP